MRPRYADALRLPRPDRARRERPAVTARGHQPALTVARLVLERPSPLRREELADLLWPDERPAAMGGPGPPGRVACPGAARDRRRAADVRHVSRRARRAPPRAARSRSTSSSRFARRSRGRAVALRGSDWERGRRAGRARARASAPAVLPDLRRRVDATVAGPRARASSSASAPHRRRRRARGRRPRSRRSRSPKRRSVSIRSTRSRRARSWRRTKRSGSRGQALTAYERCRRLLDDELRRAAGGGDRGRVPRAARAARRAARIRAHRTRARPDASEPLPFVGRQAELRASRRRLERGARRQHACAS